VLEILGLVWARERRGIPVEGVMLRQRAVVIGRLGDEDGPALWHKVAHTGPRWQASAGLWLRLQGLVLGEKGAHLGRMQKVCSEGGGSAGEAKEARGRVSGPRLRECGDEIVQVEEES
jgi:hypothetical protein